MEGGFGCAAFFGAYPGWYSVCNYSRYSASGFYFRPDFCEYPRFTLQFRYSRICTPAYCGVGVGHSLHKKT